MDKKSNKLGRQYTQTNGRNVTSFTVEEKHKIIEDWKRSGRTKREIWEKHTGQKHEHGKLLKWMRQLGYKEVERITTTFGIMAKPNNQNQSMDSFESLKKDKRIKELEKRLIEAEMKAIAYSTMIDIAEQELAIKIRKKYNTKPSKK